MAVFAWSDTHMGHKNILKYRPMFKTLEEHDEYILDQLRDTITKRDKLYLLGDNAFNYQGFLKLMSAIPEGAVVVYMGGNHDFERDKRYSRYVAADRRVSEFGAGLIKERTYKAWMSHAPIHPIELRKCVNVHGHVHDNTLPDNKYFNVSVDNCGKPINLEEIRKYVKDGKTVPFCYKPLFSL